MAIFLIESGANVHARDDNGRSSLHWAVMDNHVEVTELLLSHGASADLYDTSPAAEGGPQTPLTLAVKSGFTDIVLILIKSGGVDPLDICGDRDVYRTAMRESLSLSPTSERLLVSTQLPVTRSVSTTLETTTSNFSSSPQSPTSTQSMSAEPVASVSLANSKVFSRVSELLALSPNAELTCMLNEWAEGNPLLDMRQWLTQLTRPSPDDFLLILQRSHIVMPNLSELAVVCGVSEPNGAKAQAILSRANQVINEASRRQAEWDKHVFRLRDFSLWSQNDLSVLMRCLGLGQWCRVFRESSVTPSLLVGMMDEDMRKLTDASSCHLAFGQRRLLVLTVKAIQRGQPVHCPTGDPELELANIRTWTVDDVCNHLRAMGFIEVVEPCKRERVCGLVLLNLDMDNDIDALGIFSVTQKMTLRREIKRLQDVVNKSNEAIPKASDTDEEPVPLSGFLCPILHEVMVDPVMASDGFTYERRSIERWLTEHNTSPMTGAALPNRNLVTNNTLKSMIREWQEQSRKVI
jgi:hypothetical protein